MLLRLGLRRTTCHCGVAMATKKRRLPILLFLSMYPKEEQMTVQGKGGEDSGMKRKLEATRGVLVLKLGLNLKRKERWLLMGMR